jgi:hypothetical protein
VALVVSHGWEIEWSRKTKEFWPTIKTGRVSKDSAAGERLGRVNTNSQSFDNESKDDESGKKGVEFVEATEDPTITFESAKESFNFIPATISHTIVVLGLQPIGIGRHDRRIAQLARQC